MGGCHVFPEETQRFVLIVVIGNENIVFAYRDGDSDSLSIANLYKDAHSLASDQLIAIPCSSDEILSNESTFDTEVLNPLKTAIDALTSRTVWAVVLGYNVPGGFRHGSDIISSTSRISRIHHSFSKKLRNFLFDRSIFKRFDATDAEFAIIASRIDGPTVTDCENMINNASLLRKQSLVNGIFYIDPYSDRSGTDAAEYQDDILNFVTQILPQLNLDTFSTVFLDPYIDVVIPSVTNDSFVWSWFSDRSSLTFFKETNAARVFLYNADFDGAETVRNVTDRRWPALAIRSNYIATAGAMSDPTLKGLLRPRSFFDNLLKGSTIGEAMLCSMPFVDWTISLFGDPLVAVTFSAANPDDETTITENESWRRMSIELGKAISYIYRYGDHVENTRDRLVATEDVSTAIDLLNLSQLLLTATDETVANADFSQLSSSLLEYIIRKNRFKDATQTFITIDEYLTNQEYQISNLLVSNTGQTVSNSNLFDNGEWMFDFELADDSGKFSFYHFQLQIATDAGFNNLVFDIDSNESIANWSYEKNLNEFALIASEGVSTSFTGRRIRYTSLPSQFLGRTTTFYARVRQTEGEDIFSYKTTVKDIIFT